MATLVEGTPIATGRIGILRLALTGALAATAFFILCWLGAVIGIGAVTHMYLQLFTYTGTTSGLALLLGACMSFLAGLVGGALIALIYNLLAPLDGR